MSTEGHLIPMMNSLTTDPLTYHRPLLPHALSLTLSSSPLLTPASFPPPPSSLHLIPLFSPPYPCLLSLSLPSLSNPSLLLLSPHPKGSHRYSDAIRKKAASMLASTKNTDPPRICIGVPMTSKGTKMGASADAMYISPHIMFSPLLSCYLSSCITDNAL